MPFDTSLLDAALARRRAQDEAERQRVATRVLHLLDDLGPRYNIQRAYLFGSVIKPGRFKAGSSDVDIAVEQNNLYIEENVEKARSVRPLLPRDIQNFLHTLGISDDEN